MRGYPSQWEADVVLADGSTAYVRPIRPADAPALTDLHSRLSPDTIYFRFFSPVPRLSEKQIERFTNVDYEDRMALVAVVDDRIVAVARYDVEPSGMEAEAAFVVEDAFQGKGLGTLLLEHLAAVARTHGITKLVAHTLPNNRRMLDVFRKAGFGRESDLDEGVVRVTLDIEPSDEAAERIAERERYATARSIERLLRPSSIAVIGASRERGTIGHAIFRNLLGGGFQGPVYPVHPTAAHIASVRSYPTVLDIPDEVDLAVVAVPAPAVREVIKQCGQKRVRGLVVISAGFAEVGQDGAAAERELVRTARDHGMRMIGPNCMGVVNASPATGMNATFAPVQPSFGRVAFSSQSGALGIAILEEATRLGLGVSTFVSMGNKADVSGNDLLQYWEEDEDTDVILLYLESFGNPRKFSRLARRVSRSKPIVAVKSGRTTSGSRAAASHTAALASSDVAVDALFRQAGVIRVDTLEALFDVAQVLAQQPLPTGRRVGIVTNAGGPGILAADTCEALGLEVPELSSEVQAQLRSFLPGAAGVANPVDLVASATAEQFEHAMRAVLDDVAIDSLLVIFIPPLVTRAEDVAQSVVKVASSTEKPVVTNFLALGRAPVALQDAGVPVFAYPEQAVHALARVHSYAEWRRRPEGAVPDLEVAHEDAREIVATALQSDGGAWLSPELAFQLLAFYGISTVATEVADHPAEAGTVAEKIGFPVAIKAADVLHKSDVGGVRLNLRSRAEVEQAATAILEAAGDTRLIVQAMATAGIETVVGVTQDPSFGPLLMFGSGGTAVEVLGDQAFRILPLTDVDARELINSTRVAKLLAGHRGAPPADTTALQDVLLRVARLAEDIPEIAELDLNPVLVSEKGAVAVDARIRVEPYEPHPELSVRRLR